MTPSGVTKSRSRGERTSDENASREAKSRKPFFRRVEAERNPASRIYHPTFDLSDSGWRTRAAIRSLEGKWQKAVKAHDADALEKLLADGFEATSATGRDGSKARLLREVRNDKNTYRSARVQKMDVRLVRPGTAIVTGVATESGTKENGEHFMSAKYFTDTWKLRGGQWRCVSSVAKPLPKS